MSEATPSESKKRGWKDRFLSSSVPLEFESARLFREASFWITPEYAFHRVDEHGLEKEFSVDFLANAFPLFDDPNDVRGTLVMPVECKYRTRNKRWVFLPEAADEVTDAPNVIRIIQQFSAYDWEGSAIETFNASLPVTYKGTEINTEAGDVHDADLKHGIYQLKYALPHIVAENISREISSHPEDNYPLLLCPLLVTTADLYILRDDLAISDVEASSSLDELMEPHPYLVLRTSNGPSFESHVQRAMQTLKDIESHDWANIIERRTKREKYRWNGPASILENLAQGYDGRGWFEAFVVCSLKSLPNFLSQAQAAIDIDALKMKFSYPDPSKARVKKGKR